MDDTEEQTLVKRIKKRIPKVDEAVDAGGEGFDGDDVFAEPPKPDISAELAAAATEDGFTRRTAGLLQWIVERRTLLLGVGILAIVGAAVYVFMQRSSSAAAEEAAAAFHAGAAPYVEAHRGGPEALTGEAKQAKIDKAGKEFEATRGQYGERRISALATVGLAGARFDLGKFDEAVKLYDEFLARPDTDPFARGLALQGKAAALEEKGDLGAALEAWKAVEGLDRAAYGLLSGIQIGRLLEAQKKPADAKAHYERLQKDYADALGEMANRQLKVELERRLATLGGDPS